MALIPCYECSREISDKAPACPHCGASVREAPPDQAARDLSEMGSAGSTEYEARQEAVSPEKLSAVAVWFFGLASVKALI